MQLHTRSADPLCCEPRPRRLHFQYFVPTCNCKQARPRRSYMSHRCASRGAEPGVFPPYSKFSAKFFGQVDLSSLGRIILRNLLHDRIQYRRGMPVTCQNRARPEPWANGFALPGGKVQGRAAAATAWGARAARLPKKRLCSKACKHCSVRVRLLIYSRTMLYGSYRLTMQLSRCGPLCGRGRRLLLHVQCCCAQSQWRGALIAKGVPLRNPGLCPALQMWDSNITAASHCYRM